MEVALGVVLLVAAVLLPLAAYKDKVGQVGFGTAEGLARRRPFTRAPMYAASPVLIVIGVVALVAGLRG